jgi:high-affinity iron transporter
MLGTGLLVFREVLEAALIVSIVCAAPRGVPGRGRWVGAGIALGVVGAVLVAFFADTIASAVSGIGQELFNATVLLAAVVMIAWHAIWMASHGRELAMQMKAVGGAVQAGSRPLSALLIVVAIAVLREGSEVVLFLYGQAASGAGANEIASGIAIGMVGGVAMGFVLYIGLLGNPMRH